MCSGYTCFFFALGTVYIVRVEEETNVKIACSSMKQINSMGPKKSARGSFLRLVWNKVQPSQDHKSPREDKQFSLKAHKTVKYETPRNSYGLPFYEALPAQDYHGLSSTDSVDSKDETPMIKGQNSRCQRNLSLVSPL